MNGERITLDTNILIYAVDPRDAEKHAAALAIVHAAAAQDCWLTNQALSEFFATAIHKMKMPIRVAAAHVEDWMVFFPSAETTRDAIRKAIRATESGKFSYWDALLLAAAEEAGCAVVLSEDMADGAKLGAVTVRAPFAHDGISPAASRLLRLKGG